MWSNEDLQKSIEHAIAWNPKLCATDIGIIVVNGLVEITGTVDAYAKKDLVEEAVKNIPGVKAVVNHITIELSHINVPADKDIARAISNVFKWHWDIPSQHLRVKVEDGLVILDGEVYWKLEKEAAHKAVSNILGVKGIFNNIQVLTANGATVNVRDIEKALFRNSYIDDEEINVKSNGGCVYLTGYVPTLFQKDEAEMMAWNAAGVKEVCNDLQVEDN